MSSLTFPSDFAGRARLATESFAQALAEYRAASGTEVDFVNLPREEASKVLERAQSLLEGARAIVNQAAALREVNLR